MLEKIKKVVEAVGLIPAVLAYFSKLPQWFQPSPFYEPLIEYVAAGVAVVMCVLTAVFFRNVPPERWAPAWAQRMLLAVFIVFLLALAAGAAYVWVVRTYPESSTAVDIAQIALWAAFFGLVSIVLTAAACLFKGPRRQEAH